MTDSTTDLTRIVPQRNFGDYQNLIYARGRIDGTVPPFTTDLARLPALARTVLQEPEAGVLFDNAGDGRLTQDNVAAFDAWRVVPRQLRGTPVRDHSVTILGTPMPAPLLLGPVGVQTLAHPDGELASAAAAAALGLTYVHSTQASHSIEDVAEANGTGQRWFQLYWPDDDDLTKSFLTRAAHAGYRTLVVTLDTNVAVGYRPHDLDRGYLPFLRGIGIANYVSDPVFRASLAATPEDDPLAAALRYASIYARTALGWRDLPFLRRHWHGPIVLKGILSRRRREEGCRRRDGRHRGLQPRRPTGRCVRHQPAGAAEHRRRCRRPDHGALRLRDPDRGRHRHSARSRRSGGARRAPVHRRTRPRRPARGRARAPLPARRPRPHRRTLRTRQLPRHGSR